MLRLSRIRPPGAASSMGPVSCLSSHLLPFCLDRMRQAQPVCSLPPPWRQPFLPGAWHSCLLTVVSKCKFEDCRLYPVKFKCPWPLPCAWLHLIPLPGLPLPLPCPFHSLPLPLVSQLRHLGGSSWCWCLKGKEPRHQALGPQSPARRVWPV